MRKQQLTRRLALAYTSAVAIIAILLIISQALIQTTLAREQSVRALASTMSLQELRTQATFRNALLAVLPQPVQDQLNGLKVDPVAALTQNLADLEKTNVILIAPNTPASVSVPLQALQNDFKQMDQAGHQVLADMKRANTKDAAKQVESMFPPQQRYLIGTYTSYLALTQQADQYIQVVRFLEIVICLVSLTVLGFEYFVVVRPSLINYQEVLAEMQKAEQEEAKTPPTEKKGASNGQPASDAQ